MDPIKVEGSLGSIVHPEFTQGIGRPPSFGIDRLADMVQIEKFERCSINVDHHVDPTSGKQPDLAHHLVVKLKLRLRQGICPNRITLLPLQLPGNFGRRGEPV